MQIYLLKWTNRYGIDATLIKNKIYKNILPKIKDVKCIIINLLYL